MKAMIYDTLAVLIMIGSMFVLFYGLEVGNYYLAVYGGLTMFFVLTTPPPKSNNL